jgi:hypothetical protein
MANSIAELMETGANLLDSLEGAYGLRTSFHRNITPGLRLLVRHHDPVTQEVGVLDRVALAIGAEIHTLRRPLGQGEWWSYEAHGTWGGKAVTAIHSTPNPEDPPCVLASDKTGSLIREALPFVRQVDPSLMESVHVYDRDGEPRTHMVLRSKDRREALRTLGARGLLLENPPSEMSAHGAYGTVLLPSGLPLTVASIS